MFDSTKVLKLLMEGKGLYGDIFTEQRTYTHLQFESSKFEKVEKGVDKGVGLRAITPWKSFFASTNSFEEGSLVALAKEISGFAKGKSSIDIKKVMPANTLYPFSLNVDPQDVEIKQKLNMIQRAEVLARSLEKRIKQVRMIYRDTKQQVSIHNSENEYIKDDRYQVVFNIFIVGEEKGEMQTSYDAIGGFYGFEFFTEERMEEIVVKTVKRLTGLLEAEEAPMGMKTVVLAAEAGGTMIHEAIGHGLEADLAMEGLSCYKGMLGEKIASSFIDVVDDATVQNMRGTYACDDEGVPSERTVLVEGGVLKNYMYDRFHALKYNTRSTGNGRRESFRYKPIPRMSNTMILPGKDDPAKIISSVDDGVYVVKMGGGQVDTVRGDFVFEIQEGYIINKGSIGPMIKNATLMGNGLKVLREIDMVGDDLGFGIGTCGKDGQGVPVSDAQPTLRIPQIVVGGK